MGFPKYYKKEVLLLIVAFIILTYFIGLIYRYPMTGISVKESNSTYYIIDLDENAWAAKNGIQVGDIVAKVNNKKPDGDLLQSHFSRIEQIKTIDIVHKGKQIKYEVLYKKGDKQLIYHLIFPIIFSVIFISINIIVILTNYNKKKQSITYFIGFLTTLGFTYISVIAYGRMDLLGLLLKSITFTFTFPLFVSFMQTYYKERGTIFTNKHYIISMYLIASISACAAVLLKMFTYDTAILNSLSFGILLLITTFLLVRYYFKHKYNADILIIKSLIISSSISLIPFIFFFIIPNIFLQKEILSFELSAVFFVFIPIYFLCMLMSKSLFDFESIINRLQYYLFLSIGISGVLFVIGFIIFDKRVENLLEVVQFNILAFIVIIVSFYLKEYLDFKFRKVLYYHKRNYSNSLNRFLHQTKREYKIENLIKIIKRELEDVLNITEPICLSVNNTNNEITFFEKKDNFDFPSLKKQEWDSYGIGSIVDIKDHFAIVIAILPEYRVVLLAKRKKLNIDEIVWLETIANYVNLQFECSRKIEMLAENIEHINLQNNYPAEFGRVSFMIAEKERENLARDIHDGVLQDQLRLYRRIEMREKRESNNDFKEDLRQIREQIMDHIYITRETCNNLRPPFLQELGLEKALLTLIKKVNREANFLLYYEIKKDLQINDTEITHCIYRIVQELLSNAIKHSQSSIVKLRLFETDNSLCLDYIDDGIGMEIHDESQNNIKMGISGIKARVKGFRGTISIESTQNNGVQIKIRFKRDYLYK
ncbi:ATP-binding protein [Bacillus pretiosus]|uniref:histidine kinase n=1 Tax=Bacillus pretiosus TaxID=2983392 RepID=A0ABT3EPG3_9BACI|nr:ATP-binding protein [Bacillus pretiosus]MCW1238501.1 histidine kinase [Bacillus pretiosus]